MTADSAALRLTAFAKVNLYLHITGRRPDGYHLLDSLVAFADIGDEVVIAPSAQLTLEVDGPFAAALEGDDNLMLSAVRALAATADRSPAAALRLTKRLPVAAGLGGGSADAAAVLRGLNALWELGLSVDELREVGGTLGADVPVCLESRTVFMAGIGDEIAPTPPLPALPALLVNPGVALSTADVFAARRQADAAPQRFDAAPADVRALVGLLAERSNGLEAAARALAPAIGVVLDRLSALPGVLLARMSGSGASCFAVFDDMATAREAGAMLRRQEPRWWSAATRLGATA